MLKKRIRYKLYCDECGFKAVTKTGENGGRLPAGKRVYNDRDAIAAVDFHSIKGKLLCSRCYKKHQKALALRAKNKKKRKNKPDTKYCHLALQDRWLIRDRLNSRQSFRSIARELNVSPSTITREIKKHAEAVDLDGRKKIYTDCIFRKDCTRHVCVKSAGGNCNKYEKEVCPAHKKAPYVCNGCPNVAKCVLEKRYYMPVSANNTAKKNYSVSRKKKKLTDAEIGQLSKMIATSLKCGKSLYSISKEFGDIGVSLSTLYRYHKEGKI